MPDAAQWLSLAGCHRQAATRAINEAVQMQCPVLIGDQLQLLVRAADRSRQGVEPRFDPRRRVGIATKRQQKCRTLLKSQHHFHLKFFGQLQRQKQCGILAAGGQ